MKIKAKLFAVAACLMLCGTAFCGCESNKPEPVDYQTQTVQRQLTESDYRAAISRSYWVSNSLKEAARADSVDRISIASMEYEGKLPSGALKYSIKGTFNSYDSYGKIKDYGISFDATANITVNDDNTEIGIVLINNVRTH